MTRPATPADLPAVTELQRRWDERWFGSPEHDVDEMAESFTRVPAEQTRLAFAGDVLTGVALWSGGESFVTTLDAGARAELVEWFVAQPAAELDVLDRDTDLVGAVEAHGWRHDHSAFDLIRPVTPDWQLARPAWPEGVEIGSLGAADAAAIHHLIYRDAGWTDVPGHPDRPFDAWRSIFLTEQDLPEQQVLARRDGRLVGVAIGRTWSDGTGWVSQLAVAKAERGRGLGRALLLESLRRRVAAGATSLGLSVQASNANALALYLGVGLTVEREWRNYRP